MKSINLSQSKNVADFLIIGSGMVGLSIAYQLIKREISKKIIIIEKEAKPGCHSSGRNSGVLHAGLYYPPNSLKARVCVSGAKRLKEWILERNIYLNQCGKVIVPQKVALDNQLEILLRRGIKNGAKVELIDKNQLKELVPEAVSSTGRALWSPNTAVVKPIKVIETIRLELEEMGVQIKTLETNWKPVINNNSILLSSGERISFGHLINAAGLQADKIAHQYSIGEEYNILPFRGSYWEIKKDSSIKIKTNLYPVPDLNVPFLGVHFTPSGELNPVVTIGPTASPAWGRENYKGFEGFEPIMAIKNLSTLSLQYMLNKGGFRRYVYEQAFLPFPPFLIKAAQNLIPNIRSKDIKISKKVGIRSQLFNKKKLCLENDFICLHGKSSSHILNAISPAFTASFSFADLIIDQIMNKNEH
tara:strand:- start:451 stop:1701 length:1251 start_codon:yes stop_codon:yes gene_type:complete